MSAEVLPYTVKPHPVTGLYSGKLGMWLFLVSEIMLFGALFSAYVLLRVGNPNWPTHEQTHLNKWIGLFNTFVLICSSVTMVMSWASLKMNNLAKGKMYLWATLGLAILFLVVKLAFEYIPKINHGTLPSTNTFFALYFLITGLHGLHILGGVIVIAYFVMPGAALWNRDPEYYANRIECTGLYWHFVDLVWIFLFPLLYLIH